MKPTKPKKPMKPRSHTPLKYTMSIQFVSISIGFLIISGHCPFLSFHFFIVAARSFVFLSVHSSIVSFHFLFILCHFAFTPFGFHAARFSFHAPPFPFVSLPSSFRFFICVSCPVVSFLIFLWLPMCVHGSLCMRVFHYIKTWIKLCSKYKACTMPDSLPKIKQILPTVFSIGCKHYPPCARPRFIQIGAVTTKSLNGRSMLNTCSLLKNKDWNIL